MGKRAAYVRICTNEVVGNIGVEGPYIGHVYMDTLNAIIRGEKIPVKFFEADKETGVTIAFDASNAKDPLTVAHDEGYKHIEGLDRVLELAGYKINDEGFLEKIKEEKEPEPNNEGDNNEKINSDVLTLEKTEGSDAISEELAPINTPVEVVKEKEPKVENKVEAPVTNNNTHKNKNKNR